MKNMRLLVGLLLLAVSVAIPMAQAPTTTSTTEASAPKVPSTGGMIQQLRAVELNLIQGISDERAAKVLRASLFDSQRTKLLSQIEHSSNLLTVHSLQTALCSDQISATNQSVTALRQSIAQSHTTKQMRQQQIGQWTQRSTAMSAEDSQNVDNVLEVAQRVQQEIDSPNVTKGDGVQFDKFVLNRPKAQAALFQLIDNAAQLENLLRSKMNHTEAATQEGVTVLRCVLCDQSLSALSLAYDSSQRLVEQQTQTCELLAEDNVQTKLLLDVKAQLVQLIDNEQTETKAEITRMNTTMSQLNTTRLTIASLTI